jgi:cytochrome oxidase Cu insertion factor (SCO1/SenC/PrrC family)
VKRRRTRFAIGCAALAGALAAVGARAHDALPPRPTPLPYALPVPGSYELPAIARVPDFTLLDERGAPTRLLGLAPDQIAVVSFVYSRCGEGHGCPLALATLQGLDRRIAAEPNLHGRVRLATVSFDPAVDTPARMAALRNRLRPASDWRFLTGASPAAVAPVLAAFGQDALPLVDERGAELGLFRHVLKVFLVDSGGAVRSVYSAGFLSPELLLVDARTLLLETGRRSARETR